MALRPWQERINNPHVHQTLLNGDKVMVTLYSRTFDTEYPCLSLRKNKIQTVTTIHWRARSVALQLIEFLTPIAGALENVCIVCDHECSYLPYICSLFPHITFHCYCAPDVDVSITATQQLRVIRSSLFDVSFRPVNASRSGIFIDTMYVSYVLS